MIKSIDYQLVGRQGLNLSAHRFIEHLRTLLPKSFQDDSSINLVRVVREIGFFDVAWQQIWQRFRRKAGLHYL